MCGTAIGSAPSRMSPYGAVATGLPIASTPVASRSPVIQLIFVARSPVPRSARLGLGDRLLRLFPDVRRADDVDDHHSLGSGDVVLLRGADV